MGEISSSAKRHEAANDHAYGQTPTVSSQLAVNHSGPMGSRECPGLQTGIHADPGTEEGSRRATPSLRARKRYGRRNVKTSSKGSNLGSGRSTSRGVHLTDVPSSQKGWISQTDHRPPRTKQVHKGGTLQDGRNPSSEGPATAGRLVGETRSKRRILCCPNSPGTPSIPTGPVEGSNVPVQLPPVRTVLGPEGIHQDHAPCDSLAEAARVQDNHVHRRQPDHGLHEGGSSQPSGASSCSAGSPRIHSEPRQVSSSTLPGDAIPGVCHQFRGHDNSCATRKAAEDAVTGKEPVGSLDDYWAGISQFRRNSVLNGAGNSASPAVLQGFAAGKERGDRRHERSGHTGSNRCPYGGGATVVVGPSPQLEWPSANSPRREPVDSNRCLQEGLGSPLSGRQDRGSLDNGGSRVSHKLSGAPSCVSGDTDIRQGQDQCDGLHSDRQCDSSDLHQQEGRDTIPISDTVVKEGMELVHGEENISHGRAHSGEGEHHSGCGITSVQRSMGLEAEPGAVCDDSTAVRSPRDRSVCIKGFKPTSTVLQLETRPRSRSQGCLQAVLEGKLLCQSSSGHNPSRAITGENARSQGSAHSSGMEGPSMVPSAIGTASGLPVPATSPGNDNPPGSHSSPTHQGSRGAAGRMAYMRKSCKERELSEEATSLLMASWRTKSQSNYNSLFYKWECWCNERSRNPIQGPVTDVINFLAELYDAGYSYRSLNSYRSAISSTHDRVEGHPVGQHPMVARVLKGAFNSRPPKPRYTSTWKVSQVVTWLNQQNNLHIPLLTLAMKAVTLCALSRPCRSAELASFSFQSLAFSPEGVSISPLAPPKQCQPGRAIKEYFFPLFPENNNICPVATLQLYCDKTKQWRSLEKVKEKPVVFLTSTKPYGPASSATIARWIKTVLSKSGIDTSIFKAHSIRGASTSAAAEAGISIPEILEAGDWLSQSTFERFYYRPCKASAFGTAVLKVASNLQS